MLLHMRWACGVCSIIFMRVSESVMIDDWDFDRWELLEMVYTITVLTRMVDEMSVPSCTPLRSS